MEILITALWWKWFYKNGVWFSSFDSIFPYRNFKVFKNSTHLGFAVFPCVQDILSTSQQMDTKEINQHKDNKMLPS